MKKNPKVFIVSSGRSGTTLLVSMLNTSQEIYFPYESDFVARAFPFYSEAVTFTEEQYQHLVELFLLCSQPMGWGLSQETLLEYLDRNNPQSLADVFSIFCLAFHEHNNTKDLIWGIKSPVLIASLHEIRKLYPDCKIVHIVRDGRDVYLSYKKIHDTSKIKFGPNGVIEAALFWIDGLRRIEAFAQTEQIIELKYESLLTTPEIVLNELSNFIGVNYKPDMHKNFNQYKKNKSLTPSKLKSGIHANLEKKLDVNNIGKFQKKMSKFNQFLFEFIAAPYLEKYNYRINFPIFRIILLRPIQYSLYTLSRFYNNWRYAKRNRNQMKYAYERTNN